MHREKLIHSLYLEFNQFKKIFQKLKLCLGFFCCLSFMILAEVTLPHVSILTAVTALFKDIPIEENTLC